MNALRCIAFRPFPRPSARKAQARGVLPIHLRALRTAGGFTLIELLVALVIMALMALMSWRGIDGMLRTQEQTRTRADALLVLQTALGQWGADLDAMLALPHTVPIDWDGQVLRITRRSSAPSDEGALVVAWTRRGTPSGAQWLRWQSPPLRTRAAWQQAWQQAAQWARNPSSADQQREVALLPIDGWQIFYFRGNAWSNPLSSSDAAQPTSASPGAAGLPLLGTPGTTATSTMPDGVRLLLTPSAGQALTGQITRDWASPLLGGGKS
ncbi:PulJ/GspJ family protein [Extensimonas sp. H3M7-6]|uniref:PulJ/GspJ family protein n=1 Tax=Extensimonas soli TaxID=3031322 RepID=UPI0023DAB014|nr:prepilin-type N-terminal cleavage/methylation domain-containing protein [Extensimonas sp. H3M7-6]MDF1480570.1 prepilin-type N-terminal cleavage/methylation domain-containing protein [Extensimonas sp. H3M7-6]